MRFKNLTSDKYLNMRFTAPPLLPFSEGTDPFGSAGIGFGDNTCLPVKDTLGTLFSQVVKLLFVDTFVQVNSCIPVIVLNVVRSPLFCL